MRACVSCKLLSKSTTACFTNQYLSLLDLWIDKANMKELNLSIQGPDLNLTKD